MTEFGFDLLQLARIGYILMAVLYGLFAIYLLVAWKGGRPGAILLVVMLTGTSWGVLSAAALSFGGAPLALSAGIADVVRGGAWYLFVLVLIGRGDLLRPLSGLSIIALLIVALQLLAIGLAMFGLTVAGDPIRLQAMASLLAAVFGLLGVMLKRLNLPIVPIILGMVLGGIMETKFRTSLPRIRSLTDWIDRPVALAIFSLICIVLLLHVWGLWRDWKGKRHGSIQH